MPQQDIVQLVRGQYLLLLLLMLFPLAPGRRGRAGGPSAASCARVKSCECHACERDGGQEVDGVLGGRLGRGEGVRTPSLVQMLDPRGTACRCSALNRETTRHPPLPFPSTPRLTFPSRRGRRKPATVAAAAAAPSRLLGGRGRHVPPAPFPSCMCVCRVGMDVCVKSISVG